MNRITWQDARNLAINILHKIEAERVQALEEEAQKCQCCDCEEQNNGYQKTTTSQKCT